jgi:hypothetical protein
VQNRLVLQSRDHKLTTNSAAARRWRRAKVGWVLFRFASHLNLTQPASAAKIASARQSKNMYPELQT